MKSFTIISAIILLISINLKAAELALPTNKVDPKNEIQPPVKLSEKKPNDKTWYFSWGYNREHWGKSDIHVKQSSLGNDFVIHNVEASDYPGVLLSSDLTVPQFSFRVGKFINEDHTLAIEFNMDHTKYNNNIGQVAQVTGRINNQYVEINHVLDDNYFYYVLHNGANHIMMNFVKITPLIGENEQSMSLSAISRAGVGILFPHSGNTVLGNPNSVGKKSLGNCCGLNHGWWQVNGWTAGVELGGRFMFYRPVYLEATIKEAYGKLYNVPVYQGTADQSLWMTEGVLSMGFLY